MAPSAESYSVLPVYEFSLNDFSEHKAGRVSSVGCASAWFADGSGFDPHVRQHSFVEIGHEIISTAILVLPPNQEGQLSAIGERMCKE